MAVDMKALLALPQKQRRKIAEQLFSSLEENKAVVRLSKSERVFLEKRWQEYVEGRQPSFSPAEMRKMVFSKQ